MLRTLGIGIIGASAQRGWAKDAHVPAVQALGGLKLAAVAAGDEAKAQAAAQAFRADAGYASGFDLIKDPAVDIVTVAVKVPDHRELVRAAAAAGKHIYCEWPLGRDLAEAEEMAYAVEAARVHAAIGLQLRGSAGVVAARKVIDGGRIGRALTARVVSNTAAFGPEVESGMRFGEDAANGATLITIQGAHTIDLAIAVLGTFESLSALATTQYPEVKIGDDAVQEARATSDHLFLLARTHGGLPVGIEVAGGRPPQSPTLLEVTGTKGTLALRGGAMRGVQTGRLELFINEERQPVDEGVTATMPEASANVGSLYALLRDDILSDRRTAPDFQHAVRLTRLIDAVAASSKEGKRELNRGWVTA